MKNGNSVDGFALMFRLALRWKWRFCLSWPLSFRSNPARLHTHKDPTKMGFGACSVFPGSFEVFQQSTPREVLKSFYLSSVEFGCHWGAFQAKSHPQDLFICSCTKAVGLACSLSVFMSTSRIASWSVRLVKRSPPEFVSVHHREWGEEKPNIQIAIPMDAVNIPGAVHLLYNPIPHKERRFKVISSCRVVSMASDTCNEKNMPPSFWLQPCGRLQLWEYLDWKSKAGSLPICGVVHRWLGELVIIIDKGQAEGEERTMTSHTVPNLWKAFSPPFISLPVINRLKAGRSTLFPALTSFSQFSPLIQAHIFSSKTTVQHISTVHNRSIGPPKISCCPQWTINERVGKI